MKEERTEERKDRRKEGREEGITWSILTYEQTDV